MSLQRLIRVNEAVAPSPAHLTFSFSFVALSGKISILTLCPLVCLRNRECISEIQASPLLLTRPNLPSHFLSSSIFRFRFSIASSCLFASAPSAIMVILVTLWFEIACLFVRQQNSSTSLPVARGSFGTDRLRLNSSSISSSLVLTRTRSFKSGSLRAFNRSSSSGTVGKSFISRRMSIRASAIV